MFWSFAKSPAIAAQPLRSPLPAAWGGAAVERVGQPRAQRRGSRTATTGGTFFQGALEFVERRPAAAPQPPLVRSTARIPRAVAGLLPTPWTTCTQRCVLSQSRTTAVCAGHHPSPLMERSLSGTNSRALTGRRPVRLRSAWRLRVRAPQWRQRLQRHRAQPKPG